LPQDSAAGDGEDFSGLPGEEPQSGDIPPESGNEPEEAFFDDETPEIPEEPEFSPGEEMEIPPDEELEIPAEDFFPGEIPENDFTPEEIPPDEESAAAGEDPALDDELFMGGETDTALDEEAGPSLNLEDGEGSGEALDGEEDLIMELPPEPDFPSEFGEEFDDEEAAPLEPAPAPAPAQTPAPVSAGQEETGQPLQGAAGAESKTAKVKPADTLALMNYLKGLADALPDKDKEHFMKSEARLSLENVIDTLKGKVDGAIKQKKSGDPNA
jgi:hypothetical protein